jgi:hypothetical protein
MVCSLVSEGFTYQNSCLDKLQLILCSELVCSVYIVEALIGCRFLTFGFKTILLATDMACKEEWATKFIGSLIGISKQAKYFVNVVVANLSTDLTAETDIRLNLQFLISARTSCGSSLACPPQSLSM